ncbi:unnamed protein product [Cyprideis torosa]|uniref:eIF-4F 25 kDa subunit n=1 Tax=Cyprideis torosa TaxID=163714 RepID=A0A7R8ZJY5_9CRUS|nr:unnamed protein product [Cyprideis torosa]CAG0888170.1 unnamed protein product [Cyprideis torosa]
MPEETKGDLKAEQPDSGKQPEPPTKPAPPSKDTAETEKNAENLSPEQFIKHPLQNSWVMWFFKNDKTKAYVDNQVPITNFHTVEDFWSLWNNIQLASSLNTGWDYMLFKEGVTPRWEDDNNVNGGRWLITLNRNSRQNGELDAWWLELVLCLIGEGFDDFSDEVTGAVVNIRPKQDKISIWTRDWQNGEAAKAIGRVIKDRLKLNRMQINYQSHRDVANKTGSSARSLYVLRVWFPKGNESLAGPLGNHEALFGSVSRSPERLTLLIRPPS